ncbi:DUF6343 family protein [Goodfellowiella coeruleoviolacea]|uniref:Uncharacterized protein n=1 Tax=Goodfellowiella coeruleoviolacea TaxID=334858 RepID=A0AAE3GDG2_9PSEU|nr:DUF6343 family protein [Goodfellowiella coeruleoviolacea]MCP2165224.1 hypothetical protein [Goodfellowiella coeruleoviolacea]
MSESGQQPREPRDRADYERGLYDYHDPTARLGATPARSALTLRLWLAGFGVVFCAVAAVLAARAGFGWGAVVLGVLAVVSLIDLVWVAHRKRRGEPG